MPNAIVFHTNDTDRYIEPDEHGVDEPRYRSIHDELSRRLEEWTVETDDPLGGGECP